MASQTVLLLDNDEWARFAAASGPQVSQSVDALMHAGQSYHSGVQAGVAPDSGHVPGLAVAAAHHVSERHCYMSYEGKLVDMAPAFVEHRITSGDQAACQREVANIDALIAQLQQARERALAADHETAIAELIVEHTFDRRRARPAGPARERMSVCEYFEQADDPVEAYEQLQALSQGAPVRTRDERGDHRYLAGPRLQTGLHTWIADPANTDAVSEIRSADYDI